MKKILLEVLRLVMATWDQCYPYNALCPEDASSPSGYNGRVHKECITTAMPQVM